MIGRGIGSVIGTRGLLLEARLPSARVGEGVRIARSDGRTVGAHVASLERGNALLAPHGSIDGIALGDCVQSDRAALTLVLGTPLLGRAIAPDGTPLDAGAAPRGLRRPVHAAIPVPGERRPGRAVFTTGVRAIDGTLALARGARIGLFGAPGAGKSTLLESIVAGSSADAVVVALIGERGREAERWLSAIDPRVTIVCATSDRSPSERVRAAEVAFAQAERLRDRGLDVLLVVDSLARIAAAARDVAVALGEPVGRGGYPPSVFARQAGLLERAGVTAGGSITLIATVLSDGADEREPVSDAARAALDGHIALSERLARAGHFPAIDLPRSASRTMLEVVDPEHARSAAAIREALALLDETREARMFGLDAGGGEPRLERAMRAETAIASFLRQDRTPSPFAKTLMELHRAAEYLKADGYYS